MPQTDWAQTWQAQYRKDMSVDNTGANEPDEPTVSDDSTNKMYDRVTAGFINDTPSFSEIAQTIAATPTISALTVLKGQQKPYEALPTVIWKAQRAASVKDRAQLQALLNDNEAHDAQKIRLQTERDRLAWDIMKQQAVQGNSAVGAIYKTFADMSKNMDDERANAWLNEIMKTDISGGLPNEAAGSTMALQALQRVGGIQHSAKAPTVRTFNVGGNAITMEWTDEGWQQIGSAPRWKGRGTPGTPSAERLYQVQGPNGQVLYQPREAAVGQPAASKPRSPGSPAAPVAPPAGTQGQPGPPTVRSDADYNRLPKGTVFIDPDGRQRRKP